MHAGHLCVSLKRNPARTCRWDRVTCVRDAAGVAGERGILLNKDMFCMLSCIYTVFAKIFTHEETHVLKQKNAFQCASVNPIIIVTSLLPCTGCEPGKWIGRLLSNGNIFCRFRMSNAATATLISEFLVHTNRTSWPYYKAITNAVTATRAPKL